MLNLEFKLILKGRQCTGHILARNNFGWQRKFYFESYLRKAKKRAIW